MSTTSTSQSGARFYAWTWRWHFYAGLFVVPFIAALAASGLVMVLCLGLQSNMGPVMRVTPQAQPLPLSAQAQAAQREMPEAMLMDYIAPAEADRAAWFIFEQHEQTHAVAVDPYTATVLKTMNPGKTLYFFARRIHNDLLMGGRGGKLIEVAAGLGIVMLATGLYLFWPRGNQAWRSLLLPQWQTAGRRWWKSLHASVGFWVSLALLVFLLTGMAWTGFWGGRLVQPMSSYPAQRLDHVPTSDLNHAALNRSGLREVPWNLEQTPLPQSDASTQAHGAPDAQVTLDSVGELARQLGFRGQYHIKLPHEEDGVFTIMADTMAGDIADPRDERTVHVDRYSGKVLADIGFGDYSLAGKTMSASISLHQGNMGWFSVVLNAAVCLAVLLLCVTGVLMWWLRRPQGSTSLEAPKRPAPAGLWKGGVAVMVLLGVAFPLSGLAMLAAVLLDWLVISRVVALKRRFG